MCTRATKIFQQLYHNEKFVDGYIRVCFPLYSICVAASTTTTNDNNDDDNANNADNGDNDDSNRKEKRESLDEWKVKIFPITRAVICPQSSYFDIAFDKKFSTVKYSDDNGDGSSNRPIVDVQGINPDIFEKFLSYFYCFELKFAEMEPTEILELMKAADMFCVRELYDLCVEYICSMDDDEKWMHNSDAATKWSKRLLLSFHCLDVDFPHDKEKIQKVVLHVLNMGSTLWTNSEKFCDVARSHISEEMIIRLVSKKNLYFSVALAKWMIDSFPGIGKIVGEDNYKVSREQIIFYCQNGCELKMLDNYECPRNLFFDSKIHEELKLPCVYDFCGICHLLPTEKCPCAIVKIEDEKKWSEKYPGECLNISCAGCGEIYHTHCLNRWLKTKKNCPTCDTEFKKEFTLPLRLLT